MVFSEIYININIEGAIIYKMEIIWADYLYRIAILLFACSAIFSLVLFRKQKLCNVISNTICAVASISGASAAILNIFFGQSVIHLLILPTSIPLLTINFSIDKLSSFFILCLSVLVFSVSIYSIGYLSHYYGKRNVGLFNFLYASFILSMIFVICSGNAVCFFICWEIMSVISYFLVVFESEREENSKAGNVYIIMTHIGASFLLIAFFLMYIYTGSFDLASGSELIPAAAKNIMFIFFVIGFGTKAGIIPLHIWLPRAHPAASSNVSALMSGIMIKTAIYALVRFVLVYLNIQHTWWGCLILCVGIVSAVFGVAYALMEHDIKKLLAYHSIENIGIILIGMGVSFIAFSKQNMFVGSLALMAALFHSFNHTLFKGGLFLGAGAIQYATGTKDIEQLGGLIKKMPGTAVLMLCFSLAISAIVPFNGFVSEWLTYQSLFFNISMGDTDINIISILAVAALALSGALAAVCFVKLFGISFLGLPRSQCAMNAHEVHGTMIAGMSILALCCLAVGLYPLGFIRILDKTIVDIVGLSLIDKIDGGLMTASCTLDVYGNKISPFIIFALMVIVIIASILIIRFLGGKKAERKYGTWDCGFGSLNSRMQYTATGFSKPLRIAFKVLYRPKRKIVVQEGKSRYFPISMEYQVATQSIFEKFFYNPIVRKINRFSLRAKLTIQTGSTHMYLSYILITVLVLLLYNRIF